MRKNIPEKEIVNQVVKYYSMNGYRVETEIPNLGQSADIVAFKNGCLTIIEAKRYDWKKALTQCKAHKLIADYIYIAVLHKNIPLKLLESAQLTGIGIIQYNFDSTQPIIFLKADHNEAKWPAQRKKFNKFIEEFWRDNATLDDICYVC